MWCVFTSTLRVEMIENVHWFLVFRLYCFPSSFFFSSFLSCFSTCILYSNHVCTNASWIWDSWDTTLQSGNVCFYLFVLYLSLFARHVYVCKSVSSVIYSPSSSSTPVWFYFFCRKQTISLSMHRFGATCGRVNYKMFLNGWTIPLKARIGFLNFENCANFLQQPF